MVWPVEEPSGMVVLNWDSRTLDSGIQLDSAVAGWLDVGSENVLASRSWPMIFWIAFAASPFE